MADQTHILVVEDEHVMQRMLQSYLRARGFAVTVAEDGPGALDAVSKGPIDVVLLDIGLPGDMDGMQVCRRMRAATSVPIILVTAAQQPETKIRALDLGGDDYLVKPFNAEELLARIGAVLRRARHGTPTQAVVEIDDLTVDFVRREVRHNGNAVHFTRTEFDFLEMLVRNGDRTLTYTEILRKVWGPGYDDVRSVHTYASHLRRKLSVSRSASARLIPAAGVGYRFRLTG